MTTRSIPRFPEEGLKFLRALKRHNRREWFQPRKEEYEQHVRGPMTAFVLALRDEFRRFAPELVADPTVSLFRIYRDTRFSADKTPYKTHTAVSFPRRGLGRNMGAGLYFHIGPKEIWIGGGIYHLPPDEMRLIRVHIADRWKELDRIVKARAFQAAFSGIEGERLTRVPRGFPCDHPGGEYLKYKDLMGGVAYESEFACSAEFYPTLVSSFRTLMPLIRFLNQPLTGRARGELRPALA